MQHVVELRRRRERVGRQCRRHLPGLDGKQRSRRRRRLLLSCRGDKLANFSALGNRGGADYMTFTSASGDACVGIRRYGPAQGAGYQWILYGVRCEPRGRPITDADIDRFIGGATYRGPAASG
jgi:hypothetical protein